MDTHVIMHYDGREWRPAQLHRSDGPPFNRVRELLRGRWTRSSGHLVRDGASAFWNSNNGHRVLVLTREVAQRMLMESS